jgi:hypothetical protein
VTRRWFALAGLVVTALVVTASPASAHGAAMITIHGDGRGSVSMTAVWSDGHPITEPVGALLTASTSDGRRVGPVALRQNGDALTYPDTLAPGRWTVVIEMGTPALGRCEATVTVAGPGESPAPTEVRCGAPEPSTPAEERARSLPWYVVAIGVAVLAAAVAGWVRASRVPSSRRRRPR